MKTNKKLLAMLTAVMTVFGVTACGSSSSSGSSTETTAETTTTTQKPVAVSDTSAIDSIDENAQKDLVWMGTYDLNPAKGANKSVEMTLFNNKGGTITWKVVTDSEKFSSLATAVISNDAPDIFKYEWLAFPSQVLKNMYQPVDDIVNFDDPLWVETKETADQFVLNNKHYVAPISFSVGTLFMYDQNVIESENLDDPYELYTKGEWNWDTWYNLMDKFVTSAPDGETRFGINGWFQPQIIQQTGKTMITYENGEFKNNLNDADIERAENLLYEISKNGMIQGDWKGGARNALIEEDILFYCMGPWALTGNNGPQETDNYKVVPVPPDPRATGKYMTSDMMAYMWVKGSTAKEAVKTWYECCRIANTEPEYLENSKEIFLNANPAWDEEMYQVLADASSGEYKQIFDYGYGISPTLSDDGASADGSCVTRKLYEKVYSADENGTPYTWTSLRGTYESIVNNELKQINDAVKSFKG